MEISKLNNLLVHPDPPDAGQLESGLCSRIGYGDISKASDDVKLLIKKASKAVLNYSMPVSIVGSASINNINDNMISADGFTVKSRLWAGLAKKWTPLN